MSLSNVSPELIFNIAHYLPTSSLNSLLRTCHSLKSLLAPTLIKRITTEKLACAILRHGVCSNYLPTVRLALAHDAAAWHVKNHRGCWSAISQACHSNELFILDALVTHYGRGVLTDNDKPDGSYCHMAPLEISLRDNNLALTTFLLEHGAPANRTKWYPHPSSSNKQPLDLAGKYGTAEIAEVLVKYGADASHVYRGLVDAVSQGKWGVVRVLLREGVDVSDDDFDCCKESHLGNRTPGEINAWINAAHEGKKREEEYTAMGAATLKWIMETKPLGGC